MTNVRLKKKLLIAISRKTILGREEENPRGLGVQQAWGMVDGAKVSRSTHVGERRLVMLVLNPRRYSQGAVQQLCKCQGAQEVISLVPKAPWKWYIVGRAAWGTNGKDVHPRLGKAK